MEGTFNIIEIIWTGPFTIEQVLNDKDKCTGCGIYQIYGNHEVNGSDNLLYIGQCTDSFSSRFADHNKWWIKYETTDVQIYLGRLGGLEENIKKKDLNKNIDTAEKLLLYLCQPPYNSSRLYKYNDDLKENEYYLLINYGRKNRLPSEISTYWYNSDAWEMSNETDRTKSKQENNTKWHFY